MFINKQAVLVAGGDERMLYTYKKLLQYGYRVELFGFDLHETARYYSSAGLSDLLDISEAVVLPVPLGSEGKLYAPFCSCEISLCELIGKLKGKKLFGGGFLPKGVEHPLYSNLLLDEWLTVKNAELTAEAAIVLAFNQSKISISDSHILVVGNGRIGKQLRRMIHPVCKRLTVCARKSGDRAEIELSGADFEHTDNLINAVMGKSVIFSTAPALIFTSPVISEISKEALLIDIASAPGSIDIEAAQALEIRYISARALPGKFFPESAGNALAQAIHNLYGGDEICLKD